MHSEIPVGGLSNEQREWLARNWDNVTDDLKTLKPSEWAEQRRYLPPTATAMPGPFRFSVTPYLREIVDCFAYDSPVREVSVMKGVQLGFTVGVLENIIGYCISEVRTAAMMLLTADAELAQTRVETSIIPMLQASDLEHLIASSDEKNHRKTGRTAKRMEWVGGGFLLPYGAVNAHKLRSIPIPYLLRDEVDAYKDSVGDDGDPLKLSADRTATFEGTRKIFDISTPLIKGQSKIERRFNSGDQRYYFVRCLKCNFAQTLRWRRENKDTGEVTGITWELENGILVPGSVRYLCKECAHPHTNDDKTRLLAPEHGAEWRPTAVPVNPFHRSYHLSALNSPPGMQTWEAWVRSYLACWDTERNCPRDNALAQVHWNNCFGSTWELRGEKLRFENVSAHRRQYHFGQIPNKFAEQYCGGHVLVLTCAVDVHKDNLAVAVFGWCRDRRSILVDYWRFEGDTERLDNPDTWGRLRKLIETQEYVADDGKKYRIQLTLIDSGYRADDVYRFAAEYEAGVYPVKGRDAPPKSSVLREFSEFTTPNGQRAYSITVDFYKDRWSAALRRGWDGLGMQPHGHFNAPIDVTDKQLKELTVEVKRERIEKSSGKRIGFDWHRPSGADNELWDCLIYGNAALDLIAWDICREQLGLELVNWVAVYDLLQQGTFYTQ